MTRRCRGDDLVAVDTLFPAGRLLRPVAGHAQTLTVRDRGRATPLVRNDVVELADGRVTPRRAADQITEHEEAALVAREQPGLAVEGGEPAAIIGVEPPHEDLGLPCRVEHHTPRKLSGDGAAADDLRRLV